MSHSLLSHDIGGWGRESAVCWSVDDASLEPFLKVEVCLRSVAFLRVSAVKVRGLKRERWCLAKGWPVAGAMSMSTRQERHGASLEIARCDRGASEGLAVGANQAKWALLW